MDERRSFTAEELAIAKSVDLTAVAASLGYTVKKIGRYHTLKEMDSIRIYNRTNWFRWSREYEKGNNGGSQIDFLRVFAGMEVKEAVFWLLDFSGYRRSGNWEEKSANLYVEKKKERKKKFVLPAPARNNDYLYSYLTGDRALNRHTVEYFVKYGLIYEEKSHHNIVFKGNDVQGTTRFASMRGVSDHEGKGFKCDVAGNDKNYGFNVWYGKSDEVMVFEAAIDLMSYVEIRGDYVTNKLALGMLSDAPLTTFLREHPKVRKISFCLDNDRPGREATEALMEKYYGLDYEVEDCPPPKSFKDYNQWLQTVKKCVLSPVQEKKKVR
ncbi:MAG: DUF3991 domain-containing protein [Lachnospiraceae bacterium]|nr:DUF3991 domain-containing protein [Lachnospiraceae bacterium]